MMRARLRQEHGWGLVSSILVVGILLALSLPLMSLVDTQTMQSANERKSESSFNLAEAALDASVFVLGKNWPGATSTAYPASCTGASTELRCPSSDILTSSYSGGDYTNRAWAVEVRDDTGTEYYDAARIEAPGWPRWDLNRNGKVWVRSVATAAEGERSIIALVRRIDRTIPFPRYAMTAGWFVVTTGGNKVVLDTQGDTAQPAPVAVRCSQPPPSQGCAEYRPDHGQVSPDTTTTSHVGETAIAPEIIEMFRERARALGTYHPSGCPPSLEGEMVFIESGNCSYAGGGSFNTPSRPGMVVIGNGTLELGGNVSYYGMVYASNLQRSPGIVVHIRGAATIFGSIAVDGGGGVRLGSNGRNLVYADTIFPLITSFSGAAPVQGSWRELPAS